MSEAWFGELEASQILVVDLETQQQTFWNQSNGMPRSHIRKQYSGGAGTVAGVLV